MFVLLFILLFVFTLEDELVAVVVISVWVCAKTKLESINKNGTANIFINHVTHLAFQATLFPKEKCPEQEHLIAVACSLSSQSVAQR